jgi:hypothetical protein
VGLGQCAWHLCARKAHLKGTMMPACTGTGAVILELNFVGWESWT